MKSQGDKIKKKTKAPKNTNILTVLYMEYSNSEKAGEVQFFFKGDKLIKHNNLSDAEYRPKYMNDIFEAMGVSVNSVEETEKLTPKQLSAAKKALPYVFED